MAGFIAKLIESPKRLGVCSQDGIPRLPCRLTGSEEAEMMPVSTDLSEYLTGPREMP